MPIRGRPSRIDQRVSVLHQSSQLNCSSILIVDDQAANRELLEHLLISEGYAVVVVSDGTTALALLSQIEIDLVLLDVMMPRMTGLEVCKRVKANSDTYLIPVILITSSCDKHDRLEGIKVGADDFLSRPVNRSELLARVQSLLKLKQRTDELEQAEAVLFS